MMNFKDLGLSENTIKAIKEFGIRKPTTIQSDVIPSILEGKDIFTIAPQRCGKTTSYVFPLVDIISRHKGQNILIITASSKYSVTVSDRFAVFNKYHEINEATIEDGFEDIDNEANVIIGSPDLLLELIDEEKINLSDINILVVDDINLIKTHKQLDNLEKVLNILPSNKQNIIYTNRRSKETQDILDKILKAPEEIKVAKDSEKEIERFENDIKKEDSFKRVEFVDKRREEKFAKNQENKEKEATQPEQPQVKAEQIQTAQNQVQNQAQIQRNNNNNTKDREAERLAFKYKSFGTNTPNFILSRGIIARSNDEV